MSRERNPVSVVGRQIGTATGWDQMGDWAIVLYEFEPYEGFDMPIADLFVDYENGKFQNFDDKGNETENKDLLIVMNGFISHQEIYLKKKIV